MRAIWNGTAVAESRQTIVVKVIIFPAASTKTEYFRKSDFHTNDVTMMVLRVNQRRPHYSLRERLGALLRLSVSVIRAIDPRAERPPIPDFHPANVGGAIIPALAQLWRANKRRT